MLEEVDREATAGLELLDTLYDAIDALSLEQ